MADSIARQIALAYLDRREHGLRFMEGTFSSGLGIWLPLGTERAACCEGVEPVKLWAHCGTLEHVMTLFGHPRGCRKRGLRAQVIREIEEIRTARKVALRLSGRS